jgi:hypothetical protein
MRPVETKSMLRKLITQKAVVLNCERDVVNLTDLNAVRFIQGREGYSQCFGQDILYKPSNFDERRCAITDCYWGMACQNYRLDNLAPVDQVFPEISKHELDEFIHFLSMSNQNVDPVIHHGEVGLQIRSYQNVFSATRKMLVATPRTVVGEKKFTSHLTVCSQR